MHAGADDAGRGLYEKFTIRRTDGRSEPGEKHERCSYFVLDLDHDPYSVPALKAYADACRERFPALAKDLDDQGLAITLRGTPAELKGMDARPTVAQAQHLVDGDDADGALNWEEPE